MDARIEKIARDLMGWELSLSGDIWCDVESGECLRDIADFNPLEDCNAARAMEDALYEKGLWDAYKSALAEIMDYPIFCNIMRADNAQRVAACVRVLEERDER